MNRIAQTFKKCAGENRKALVIFVSAGNPDIATTEKLIIQAAEAGADIVELGVPFSDPMADGPAIQAAGLRALAAGQTMIKTLKLVREFRAGDSDTPIVLMGYYNPIYIYGVDKFLADAIVAAVTSFELAASLMTEQYEAATAGLPATERIVEMEMIL